jgi:hypothetical protein
MWKIISNIGIGLTLLLTVIVIGVMFYTSAIRQTICTERGGVPLEGICIKKELTIGLDDKQPISSSTRNTSLNVGGDLNLECTGTSDYAKRMQKLLEE